MGFVVERFRDRLQLALLVAPDGDNWMHGDVHREVMAIDRGCDGIDEERHVVVDHLDERVR